MRWTVFSAILIICLSSSAFAKGNRVSISFLWWPDPGGGFEEVVEDFERDNPLIDVEMIEGPTSTDLRQNMYITSFLAGQSTYDLILMDIVWVAKFAHQGWLQPLEDWFDREARKDFLPGDIDGGTYAGKIYRVPLQTDAGVLYYRKDLLGEVGLGPPRTWGELVRMAKKLQKPPTPWGFVFQGKQYEGLVCNFLEFIWSFGGNVLNQKGEVVLDSPQNVEALSLMGRLIHVHGITPPGITTYEEEECRHIFQEGNALFCRNWPYQWTLAQGEKSPVRGKIGIAPLPHHEGQKSYSTLGGWGFGISRLTKNKDACKKFIRYVTGPEAQKKLHFKSGIVPARKSLFEDEEILKESPYYRQLFGILLGSRPRPVHPDYSRISDIISRNVHKALLLKRTPENALKKAHSEIKRILKR
jgi:multiple sugar transport system substrate-binding protein